MTLAEIVANDIMENYASCEFTANDFDTHLNGLHRNSIIQALKVWNKKGWLEIVGLQSRSGKKITKNVNNTTRIYSLVKGAIIEPEISTPMYLQSQKELGIKQCADLLDKAMKGWK